MVPSAVRKGSPSHPSTLVHTYTLTLTPNSTRYMQVHRSWLDVIPGGFGRLVDKGFANTGLFYKNRSRGYVPAFVRKVRGHLTASESKNSYQQSSDRYTCETYFSRVKKAFSFNGQISHKKMRYVQSAWLVSHYNANLMNPLRYPSR